MVVSVFFGLKLWRNYQGPEVIMYESGMTTRPEEALEKTHDQRICPRSLVCDRV